MLLSRKRIEAEYIVDIHSHILPGIDDGSKNMSETLKMLEIAKTEGITHIIATPHYKSRHDNANPNMVNKILNEVQQAAYNSGIDIKLYQGNEIMYHDSMCEELDSGYISCMCSTDYVLVEFYPTDSYQYIRNSLDEIISEGYQPILAHIERYECILETVSRAVELRRMGIEIQANASSIVGKSGKKVKKLIHTLLGEQVIDYIATDSHRCEGERMPSIKESVKQLYKRYDYRYVNKILYGNAMNRLL